MSVNFDNTAIPISFYLAETCCSNFFNASIENEKTTSSIKKNIAILNAHASNSLLVITNIFVSTIQFIIYKFLSNTSALINMLTKGKIRPIENFSISADMTANACIEGLKLHLQYTSVSDEILSEKKKTPFVVAKYIVFAASASKTLKTSIDFFNHYCPGYESERAKHSNRLLQNWAAEFIKQLESVSINDDCSTILKIKLFKIFTNHHINQREEPKTFNLACINEITGIIQSAEKLSLSESEIPSHLRHDLLFFQKQLDKLDNIPIQRIRNAISELKEGRGLFEINVSVD